MRTLLGIDVGTSATRAVLINETGDTIGAAARRHSVSEPGPGRAEHDADQAWWRDTCEVLRELATRFPIEMRRLAAIGISAVGASIVPVDRAGKALRPAILYGIDSRALKQMETLKQLLGPDKTRQRTGREFSTQSVGPKILWIEEQEREVAVRTAKYLPPTAFVAARLGAEPCIDPHTALSMHPLFRCDRMSWDEDAVRLVCRRDQLPAVAPAGTPIGVLDVTVARELGLPEAVPICCGTADVLADGLSSGAVRPGDTMVMYGSTLFIVHVSKQFQPQTPFWASVYPISGYHCLVTGTSTAGAAADWLLDVLGSGTADNKSLLLAAAAKASAAQDGLIFLPYLRGERAPIFMPSARGVFFGLTTKHTKADLYRAVLESIGFSLRHVLDEMHLASKRILVSGGGSDLPVGLQIAVDACGKPQLRARRGRSAGYGAALLAGLGSGVIRLASLNDSFFGGFDEIEPREVRQAEQAYALYRSISAAMVNLLREDRPLDG